MKQTFSSHDLKEMELSHEKIGELIEGGKIENEKIAEEREKRERKLKESDTNREKKRSKWETEKERRTSRNSRKRRIRGENMPQKTVKGRHVLRVSESDNASNNRRVLRIDEGKEEVDEALGD